MVKPEDKEKVKKEKPLIEEENPDGDEDEYDDEDEDDGPNNDDEDYTYGIADYGNESDGIDEDYLNKDTRSEEGGENGEDGQRISLVFSIDS